MQQKIHEPTTDTPIKGTPTITNNITGAQSVDSEPPLPRSYMPGGMVSPGTQAGTSFLDVNSGSDGDNVEVSDAAHEICHG